MSIVPQRAFGRTGLTIPEIVIGGGVVGGLLVNAPEESRREALRRAITSGIDWIDTAAQYGHGESEKTLGRLLPDLEDETGTKVRVSTKFNLDPASTESFADQAERSLTESLGRLGRDRVVLVQLHNRIGLTPGNRVLTPDRVLGDGGAVAAMERLREKGLTDHIGITALGEAGPIGTVIASGRIDSAQVYLNMLNPSAARSMPDGWPGQNFGELLDTCAQHGVAAMGIRVYAGGMLARGEISGREVTITDDADLEVELRRAQALFGALGLQTAADRARTALRFVLDHKALACAVIGITELGDIGTAVQASAANPLSQSTLETLEELYGRAFT